MPYEITIKKTEIREEPAGKTWDRVSTDADGNSEYGYTPEIIKKQTVETTVYRQVIDEIDLFAVIKAVNNMPIQPNSNIPREFTLPD